MQKKSTVEVRKINENIKKGDVIVDIQTSTRFWRTSMLLRADMILAEKDTIREINLISEKESDEYDILIELAAEIRAADRIFSFNGKSFDIPHLKGKFNAYRMDCALEEKEHIDLLPALRKYDPLLDLPSHRLTDYYAQMTGKAQDCTDALATCTIIPMLELEGFINGCFEVVSCSYDHLKDTVCFELQCDLPCPIRFSSDYYSLRGSGRSAEITVRSEQGRLRMYHADYHNYVFLPIEEYAVHKSLASYIAPSRKIACDRENCYTYITFNSSFAGNNEKMKKYLLSILGHCVK